MKELFVADSQDQEYPKKSNMDDRLGLGINAVDGASKR
jgi:hypothetical protein